MRVATFNVRHCEGLDGAVDVDSIAEMMRATGAEVIALQELDRGLPRSGRVDQAEALREATGMNVAFAATLHRRLGDYGIGIASAGPLETRFEPLPQAGEEEPRGVLYGTYAEITVITTHLTRDAAARPLQLEAVARLARLHAPTVLVMGDLNVAPRDLGPLNDAPLTRCDGLPTLPARRPRRQIDHILVGPGLEIVKCWTVPTDASDHRPLVAEIAVD